MSTETEPLESEVFDNVWDALADSPGEAAYLTACSNLMIAIEQQVRKWRMPRAKAARRLSISQRRLDDLMRGKLAKFGLNDLFKIAAAAQLDIKLKVNAHRRVTADLPRVRLEDFRRGAILKAATASRSRAKRAKA